jgi:hypothetical protein
VLKNWNGQALPAVTYGVSSGVHELLIEQTLNVGDDETFTITETDKLMPSGELLLRTGVGAWSKDNDGYSFGRGHARGGIENGQLILSWSADLSKRSTYVRE